MNFWCYIVPLFPEAWWPVLYSYLASFGILCGSPDPLPDPGIDWRWRGDAVELADAYGATRGCVKTQTGLVPAVRPPARIRWEPNLGGTTSMYIMHPDYRVPVGGYVYSDGLMVRPTPDWNLKWQVEATREGLHHEYTHLVLLSVGLSFYTHPPSVAGCTPRWFDAPGTGVAAAPAAPLHPAREPICFESVCYKGDRR